MSDKTEAERRALPWYDPEAIPRFEGDATHCRHPDCRDTNWGGRDRVHKRSSTCPPLVTAADQPTTEPSEAVVTLTVGDLADALWSAANDDEGICDADRRTDVYQAYLVAAGLLAPASQPAAETEVQWGVRRPDGAVRTASSEEGAQRFVKQRPDWVVVKHTRTPWEEA